MSETIKRTPVFITGCQRSGTTLLGLILDSHPKIRGIDEDRFILPSIYRYLCETLPADPEFISFKLPMYAHMMSFLESLPNRRIIWCIRNPLDAVCSMAKLQIGDGEIKVPWALHPKGGWLEITNTHWVLNGEQRKRLDGHIAEYIRLRDKLNKLSQTPENLNRIDHRDCVFSGALCWALKNELPSLYKARNIDFHVVRYEDLVSNPRERIAEILDYIGADWSEEVLMHHQLHEGTSIGKTSNTRPIDRKSVGQGKKNLSQEEQELVRNICGATAKSWGYAI